MALNLRMESGDQVLDGGQVRSSLARRLGLDGGCRTALRDISQLVELGILRRGPGGGRRTSYEFVAPKAEAP